jgi:flagellar biosynthesis protein
VAAAGTGPVARQIVEIAFANDVAVREDADLASLLAEIEIDSVILLPAFAAVAEILAYLYRLNGTTQPDRTPS